MNRRILLLVTGHQQGSSAKTAINLLRYCQHEVVGIIDQDGPPAVARDLFGLGGSLPVVQDLSQAPAFDTLVVGIAPSGGRLPPKARHAVLAAAQQGAHILSGLHQFLSDDPDIAEAARRSGAQIHDVRKNSERDVAHRENIDPRCLRIHTVGNDCNVGKMVVSLELARALKKQGCNAKFVATGQTGIMIEGDGCPVDAVVSDFISGAAEKLVLRNQHHEILLIEGQGSILHPRYSSVTLGLLHGCVPHGLILCYELGRETVSGMSSVPLTPLPQLIQLYESLASPMHPCRVIGIGLNSRRSSAAEAEQEAARQSAALGLPVVDVIRHGPQQLTEAILNLKTQLPSACST